MLPVESNDKILTAHDAKKISDENNLTDNETLNKRIKRINQEIKATADCGGYKLITHLTEIEERNNIDTLVEFYKKLLYTAYKVNDRLLILHWDKPRTDYK